MSGEADWWFDEAAGPLVRPYAMTRGRTRPNAPNLNLVTQVRVARQPSDPSTLSPEHLQIIELCTVPLSVAEVAAYLNVPLVVVKVLISDLIERGDVQAGALFQTTEINDTKLLQAVLDGIRRI
ncbi:MULTISPECIES: DUF742 domain-containing protein [Actinokineospora]|uniref:DUF742 domain-containing protein n=3 Tax=Actinokineospora TaxID=39845 RepID=A0A9W6V5A3_9PSEU|nr:MULTISPECIES: DUF742 domain-containing protein [Actinokineospora]MCP2306845.1 Protein of unknown function (DUF742) [Actinokineospora globicatena]RLK54265.1 uncharacterized protein DUF742 [Actinokineospora cianjurensis]SEQ94018.1 Protein of unknown function [Actinokineospora terrae]GLW82286.1 hypothetical protein Aglo01_67670 [Actinokineospora globicatena]GLW89121.1 hypothetical protein Aglo02_67600 [Actinokineospora globicatena]